MAHLKQLNLSIKTHIHRITLAREEVKCEHFFEEKVATATLDSSLREELLTGGANDLMD